MPTIPQKTYTPQTTITSQGVEPRVSATLNPNQVPLKATESLKQFFVNDYIQEKQTEANNKAYERMNDFYVDEKNEDGNITQKGLMTIISESKEKSNPSEADQYFDANVKSLFDAKLKKFGKINNFEKKAIERKFYATAGLMKTKVLEQARINLIDENYKTDDDTFVTETMILKQMGTVYIDTYKQNLEKRINLNPNYDDGTKKKILQKEYENGILSLAESMAKNEPTKFKEAIKAKKFKDVDPAQLIKLDIKADEEIKDRKFNVLTEALNLPLDAEYKDLLLADKEIQNGNFGGIGELQSLYQSLSPTEQKEFKEYARKKARAKKTDMQFMILAANQQVKQETATESKKIFENIDKKNGVTEKKLKQIFGGNQATIEQFMDLQGKIVSKTADKISNFERNDDIIKLIINGEVERVDQKFILPGETGEGKSILQRVGEEINTADAKYLNNLISISDEDGFKDNHNAFFNFLEDFKVLIAGSNTLQALDADKDVRLSNFKYIMYNRYIQGLQQGKTSANLLNADNNNPDFIGKDISKFVPKANDVFKSLSKAIKKSSNLQSGLPKPQWGELSKKYGKELSLQEYKNTKEYQNWLKSSGGE